VHRDLNTALANRQISWLNQAREEMRLAELVAGQPIPNDWPEYAEMVDAEAKKHVEAALLHARRAAFAAQGLLYLPADGDLLFQMDPANAELVNQCNAQHRCVYTEPLSDGRDLTALAKLQAGVGDMTKVLSSFVARDRLG